MSNTRFQVTKRKIAAVAGAAAVFAAVTVSAATLGGVQTDSVGANSNAVASPVTKGVALNWDTQYSATEKAYVIKGINLATISEGEKIPATAKVNVTLTDKDGKSLGEYVSTDGAEEFAAPKTVVTAHDVTGVSVVINGGAVTKIVTETD